MSIKFAVPRFISEDFYYKLFALLLAAVVWLFVSQQLKRENATYTVPVVISYEADKMVVEPRSFNVQVMVRGSRGSLDRLSSQDINVNLSLPLLDEGIFSYELRIPRNQVHVPSGIQVEDVRPSTVTLQVDRIVSKAVQVRIREEGSLPPGYQIQERRALPSSVRISGASRLLDDINEVMTEPVVMSETTVHSFQQQNVRLSVPPDIQVTPRRVHVSYEISRHTTLDSFNELPVRVLTDTASGLQVASPLPRVSVTLRGPRNLIEAMEEHKIQPFVDLTAITSPGHYSRPINVWLAQDRVSVEYLHPSEVEVELVRETKPPPAAGPEVEEDAQDEGEPASEEAAEEPGGE